MNCAKADELMMRYMDGTLSEDDAVLLKKHLDTCAACAEDFSLYDEIVTHFSEDTLVSAPEGFEKAVMERIRALPALVARPELDTLLYLVWGAVSVLFGIGLIVFFNRDAIIESLAANPAFARYIDLLPPVSDYVTTVLADVSQTVSAVADSVQAYISSFRYLLLIIFVILAAAQMVIARRFKSDKPAESHSRPMS
ncbi:MAG: zf-HC2 domain-containing protein [Clostridiales bacterium]|jgi:hypothetical protein|nr:zf-HC2 domain-containing protein [Clostridiales bacterium]